MSCPALTSDPSLGGSRANKAVASYQAELCGRGCSGRAYGTPRSRHKENFIRRASGRAFQGLPHCHYPPDLAPLCSPLAHLTSFPYFLLGHKTLLNSCLLVQPPCFLGPRGKEMHHSTSKPSFQLFLLHSVHVWPEAPEALGVALAPTAWSASLVSPSSPHVSRVLVSSQGLEGVACVDRRMCRKVI